MLPSQRGFKLASLNINELITHIDQLRILLAHSEIDILSINETVCVGIGVGLRCVLLADQS